MQAPGSRPQKLKWHPFFYFFLVLISFSSCQKETVSTDKDPQTLLNVAYGSDTAQRMDVYLPADRSSGQTKAIVMIHGGSWTSGHRSELRAYVDTFKRRMPHLAVINVSYRLVKAPRIFPVPEQDVNAAIEFIANKATEWGIDKANIALLGVSAGGHLALLQAYKQQAPVRIKAVVDFFGPTDLEAMYRQAGHPLVNVLLSTVTGTTPDANNAVYYQLSPVNFVTAQSPPTLILHGTDDEVVPLSQSQALQQKLQVAGVPHLLQVYPGEGHGWYGTKLSQSFDLVQTFLNQHL